MSTWALIITLTFSPFASDDTGALTMDTYLSETWRPLPSEAACHHFAATRRFDLARFMREQGRITVWMNFNHACVEEHEA